MADAVIEGLGASAAAMGQDLGELEEFTEEAALAADPGASDAPAEEEALNPVENVPGQETMEEAAAAPETPSEQGMAGGAGAEEQLAEQLDEKADQAV